MKNNNRYTDTEMHIVVKWVPLAEKDIRDMTNARKQVPENANMTQQH